MLRYFLRPKASPTYYNTAQVLQKIGWHSTRIPFLAIFGEKNFHFNEKVANQLECKDQLAELVQSSCPEIMPQTYLIDDDNWMVILNIIAELKKNTPTIWILKPAFLNNGHHILIFDTLTDITNHFLKSNRMGGPHVLQEYINTPHLLKGPNNEGHKYSLRMFMVLTNYDGAFLYPHGYFNIAVTPYNANSFDDLTCHITNEHLQEDRVNVIQIPTFKYDLFKPIYPKIKNTLSKLIEGLKIKHPDIFKNTNLSRKLALFGMDFIVDENQQVWLIEANHGPCFPTQSSHDLQNSLYQDFWNSLIDDFVEPISRKISVGQHCYKMFEALGEERVVNKNPTLHAGLINVAATAARNNRLNNL